MSRELQGKPRKGNGEDAPPFTVVDRRPAFAEGGEMAPAAPRLPTVVEQLQARADEAERRAREISAAYRQMEIDRDAFRERLGRDLERRVDQARADLLRRVVGIVDDLERAIAAARTAGGTDPLVQGVVIIRDRLVQVLAAEGVERVETCDRPFDPGVAEAVATEIVDDPARNGIVLEEIDRGYTLRGALLRPARVRVARCPAAAQDAGPPPAGGPED